MVFPTAPLRTAVANFPRSIAPCCGGGGPPHRWWPPPLSATDMSGVATLLPFLAASSCYAGAIALMTQEGSAFRHGTNCNFPRDLDVKQRMTARCVALPVGASRAGQAQPTFILTLATVAARRFKLDSSSNQANTSKVSASDGEASPASFKPSCAQTCSSLVEHGF